MGAVGSFTLAWGPLKSTQGADFHSLNLGTKPYNPEQIAQNKANRESRHSDCIKASPVEIDIPEWATQSH